MLWTRRGDEAKGSVAERLGGVVAGLRPDLAKSALGLTTTTTMRAKRLASHGPWTIAVWGTGPERGVGGACDSADSALPYAHEMGTCHVMWDSFQ